MNKLKGFRLAAVVLTLLFLGPGLVQAQRQAPTASAQPPARTLGARPANTVRARPAQAPRMAVTRARGHITSGTPFNNDGNDFVGFGGAPLTAQQLLDPVPGLGFDFSDLAARNSDLLIKAAIDPATQWRLAIAERLLRDNPGFVGVAETGGFLLD